MRRRAQRATIQNQDQNVNIINGDSGGKSKSNNFNALLSKFEGSKKQQPQQQTVSIDVENAPSSKSVPDEETQQPRQLSALVSKFGGSQKQQQLQTSQHSSQHSSQQDGNDSNSSHTEQKPAAAAAAQSSSADDSTQSGPIARNNGNSGDNEIHNSQGENEKRTIQ